MFLHYQVGSFTNTEVSCVGKGPPSHNGDHVSTISSLRTWRRGKSSNQVVNLIVSSHGQSSDNGCQSIQL